MPVLLLLSAPLLFLSEERAEGAAVDEPVRWKAFLALAGLLFVPPCKHLTQLLSLPQVHTAAGLSWPRARSDA